MPKWFVSKKINFSFSQSLDFTRILSGGCKSYPKSPPTETHIAVLNVNLTLPVANLTLKALQLKLTLASVTVPGILVANLTLKALQLKPLQFKSLLPWSQVANLTLKALQLKLAMGLGLPGATACCKSYPKGRIGGRTNRGTGK